MAKNRANLDSGTDSVALARQDINDMFADLGYGITGDESKVTTTGEANKIVKTDGSGGVTFKGSTKIQKWSIN